MRQASFVFEAIRVFDPQPMIEGIITHMHVVAAGIDCRSYLLIGNTCMRMVDRQFCMTGMRVKPAGCDVIGIVLEALHGGGGSSDLLLPESFHLHHYCLIQVS